METSTIKMGNDEFILYIRKQYPKCKKTNDKLGEAIWKWIEKNAKGKKTNMGKQVDSLWLEEPKTVNALALPASSTQFEFPKAFLPQLYGYLDELGSN